MVSEVRYIILLSFIFSMRKTHCYVENTDTFLNQFVASFNITFLKLLSWEKRKCPKVPMTFLMSFF